MLVPAKHLWESWKEPPPPGSGHISARPCSSTRPGRGELGQPGGGWGGTGGSPLPGSTQERVSGEDTQNLHEPQLSHLLCEDPDDLLAGFSVHSMSLSPPTLAPPAFFCSGCPLPCVHVYVCICACVRTCTHTCTHRPRACKHLIILHVNQMDLTRKTPLPMRAQPDWPAFNPS